MKSEKVRKSSQTINWLKTEKKLCYLYKLWDTAQFYKKISYIVSESLKYQKKLKISEKA